MPTESGRDNPRGPGFQGSETSGVIVKIYSHGDDPIVLAGGASLEFLGSRETDLAPAVVSVQTNKVMGAAEGSFSIVAKAAKPTPGVIDLFDQIVDDDWVDITFTRFDRQWHTIRGLVENVRRTESAGQNGATTITFTIDGKDFGSIWQKTPVWFSPQAAENIHGHVAAKVFTADAAFDGSTVAGNSLVLGSPAAAVRGYLFGFLEELGGFGRANWELPDGMPGRTGTAFVTNVFLDSEAFNNQPERVGIDPNFITAGGTLWDLAVDWSDPLFTELYTDILPANGDPLLEGDELVPGDSAMTVIYRDKPFPLLTLSGVDLPNGKDSPWFKLPTYTVPLESIASRNIGKSGLERYNAYFISSPLHQETLGQAAIDIVAPLWDKQEIFRHGLRRFDVQSKYQPANANLLNLVTGQRELIRYWYCLNPYLLSGSLELAMGRPDIKIGTRVIVPGTKDRPEEQYYVEQVSHSWQLVQGMRTSLGVTRGWRGTDDELLIALSNASVGYEVERTVTT